MHFSKLLLSFVTFVSGVPSDFGSQQLLNPEQMSTFVRARGTQLTLGKAPFYFGGTNNYYLFYAEPRDVDAFFADAVRTKAAVVRTWLFCDGNSAPGGRTNPFGRTIWFQDIDRKSGQMIFNDDKETGLGRFDYVLDSARRHGVKLIVTLANNWNDFGGVDVYVDRLGSPSKYHSEFFTDNRIKDAYKQYAQHVLTRRNEITNTVYRDDPTIMAIELINEARCVGSNFEERFPADPNCNAEQLTRWIDEMSTYIKQQVDSNHLIAIGDEGFWNKGPSYPGVYSNVWDGSSGTDFVKNAALPNIDLLGIHVYFDHWGTKQMPLFLENSKKYLLEHAEIARQVNKPIYVGEYGYEFRDQQREVYPELQKVMEENGYCGTALWILMSQYQGKPYPVRNGYHYYAWDKDIDAVTINHASRMLSRSS